MGTPLQPGGLVVRVPTNVARAFYAEPGAVAKGTAKGLRDALLGIPGSVIAGVTDPMGTAKLVGKDYARRYGPLLEGGGDREFIERIKKEGAAGELLDASLVVAGPGSVAGRAASSVARKGALGAQARRTVTEPRRRVRTSGGASRGQEIAPTLGRAVRQKRRDEAAFRGQQRAATGAGPQRKARAPKGPVRLEVREALEAGEVVPSRPTGVRVRRTESGGRAIELSRTPSNRKLTKAQQRAYATAKGRTLQSMRREQRVEVGGAKRNLAGLNKHERAAFKDALQLGATTPKAARAVLSRRLALIERERASDAEVLDTDEAPVLRALLEAPERYSPTGWRGSFERSAPAGSASPREIPASRQRKRRCGSRSRRRRRSEFNGAARRSRPPKAAREQPHVPRKPGVRARAATSRAPSARRRARKAARSSSRSRAPAGT